MGAGVGYSVAPTGVGAGVGYGVGYGDGIQGAMVHVSPTSMMQSSYTSCGHRASAICWKPSGQVENGCGGSGVGGSVGMGVGGVGGALGAGVGRAGSA